MPKRKKSGDHSVSKGQRPNVNKKIRNMVRKHKLKNRPLEDIVRSINFKKAIMHSAKTTEEKRLRAKFLEDERVEKACSDLLSKFEEAGLTRAGAIFAIKTNQISSLEDKWSSRKKIWISQQQKKGKNSGEKATVFNAIAK